MKTMKTIKGTLVQFDNPFKIGDFALEFYIKGMFGDVAKINDIPITWMGDSDNIIGTLRSGQIYENDKGIYIKNAKVNKIIPNDIYIGFLFKVNEDSWEWADTNTDDRDIRTISSAKLYSISIEPLKHE